MIVPGILNDAGVFAFPLFNAVPFVLPNSRRLGDSGVELSHEACVSDKIRGPLGAHSVPTAYNVLWSVTENSGVPDQSKLARNFV